MSNIISNFLVLKIFNF